VEHQRDSPEVHMFCSISSEKVYGPFIFAKESVNGMAYLDMLELWHTDIHIPARRKSSPLPL
jgi:hypothetical protein